MSCRSGESNSAHSQFFNDRPFVEEVHFWLYGLTFFWFSGYTFFWKAGKTERDYARNRAEIKVISDTLETEEEVASNGIMAD